MNTHVRAGGNAVRTGFGMSGGLESTTQSPCELRIYHIFLALIHIEHAIADIIETILRNDTLKQFCVNGNDVKILNTGIWIL